MSGAALYGVVAARIKATIAFAGELVRWEPIDGSAAADDVLAVICRPGDIPLIGDATQDGWSVFVAGDALPKPPEHGDRLVIDGVKRAISEPKDHRAAGVLIAWEMRCAG